ncbi:MAG: cytochrome c [Microscillaceae bacterium]|jgi:nitrite reductase (NO-forming)|nr:cytochrome c [Microscillaceae bacterium]
MKKSLLFFGSLLITTSLLVSFTDNATSQDPLQASIKRGKTVYESNCLSCHMNQGEGIPSVFPPLAKSDYLMADKNRAIKQVIKGLKGKIVVNGVTYDGEMPANDLSDQQVVDVMNYIRNSWGNKGKIVTIEEVKAARKMK